MISNFIRGGGEVKFGKWWCPFKLRMIEEMAEWGVKKPGKRCLQALVDRKQRLPKFWIQSYFSFSWFMMSMHKNIYYESPFILKPSSSMFRCVTCTVILNIISVDFVLMPADVTWIMTIELSQLKIA